MMAGITHYWEGTTLFITSDSGTTGCDLIGPTGPIGIRGPQGVPGIGASGFSPLVNVEAIAGGTRVTITDANGAHTFDVMNGNGEGIAIDMSEYYTRTETDAAISAAVNNLEIPDSTPIATVGRAGKVKPDGVTIVVTADGTISSIGQGVEVQEVYVGETEPTDPNILLWFNPNDGNAVAAATVEYVDEIVGDFSTALDSINGEVV
jgi:hypothetical protein